MFRIIAPIFILMWAMLWLAFFTVGLCCLSLGQLQRAGIRIQRLRHVRVKRRA